MPSRLIRKKEKEYDCYASQRQSAIDAKNKAALRLGGFGIVAVGVFSMQQLQEWKKGKPWIMIPLECVTAFTLNGNKEIRIRADELFIFRSLKAKEIYAALQQILPEKAK